MWRFLQDYGLWILLGVIFLAMQAFGFGCCGGHRHEGARGNEGKETEGESRREGAGESDRRPRAE